MVRAAWRHSSQVGASIVTLRPYQEKALAVLRRLHERRGRGIVMLPTGTGKTVLGLALVREIIETNTRALWLAHRDELIEQPYCRCPVMGISDVGRVKAEMDKTESSFVIASVQTAHRDGRLARLAKRPFGLVVVDEAHHASAPSYRKVLSACAPNGTTIVGLTATPFRHDNANLAAIFPDGIVFAYQIVDAIAAGYLVDVTWRRLACDLDLSDVGLSNGDFSASDLDDVLFHADIPKIVATGIASDAPTRRCVVYTPTVRTAHATNNALVELGIKSAVVTGDTPIDERRSIIGGCASGDVRVVVNCAVLTEGWDCPPMDCAVIARPTRSDGLYRQMIGRVLRPYPGKEDALVLDVTPRDLRDARGLVTAPVLFGIDPEKVGPGRLATDSAGKMPRPGVSRIQARLRWQPRWVRHDGAFGVSAGTLGLIAIVPLANGLYAAALVNRKDITPLGPPTDLDMAVGLTFDVLRRSKTIADENAEWRNAPPSQNQLRALEAWRVSTPVSTKGEASDAINLAILKANVQRIARCVQP